LDASNIPYPKEPLLVPKSDKQVEEQVEISDVFSITDKNM